MSTSKKGEQSLIVQPKIVDNQLDEYTARVCLTRTMGETFRVRETATNARTYFVANLVFSAILEKDMSLIEILANRIDGTIPTSETRDSFANLMGDAIDDVLDMERHEQMNIMPNDLVIVALAKTVFHIATAPTKGNPILKREKQKAVEMIYGRVAGRRTQPVRPLIETKYVKPAWMQFTEPEEHDDNEQQAEGE